MDFPILKKSPVEGVKLEEIPSILHFCSLRTDPVVFQRGNDLLCR